MSRAAVGEAGSLVTAGVVLVLIAVYAVCLSRLSLERHAAHGTNALDLGYYSNTLWNTLHGQPFRFTTYHQANFVFPEFDPNVARKPDNLLAYHVEPILLPPFAAVRHLARSAYPSDRAVADPCDRRVAGVPDCAAA